MNWTKIELKEPIVYRDGGTWYKIKLLKRIKGVAMAEVERFSTSVMRRVDELPVSVIAMIEAHTGPIDQLKKEVQNEVINSKTETRRPGYNTTNC